MSSFEQKIIAVQPVAMAIVNGFRISRVDLMIASDSAIVFVDLLNNGELVQPKTLLLDGNDYINWGANQPYLNNWVCQKLGLVCVS